jgi:decaprenylphospho-beta-D-erythro-pentofuranosid-2-ulose 2-reductase
MEEQDMRDGLGAVQSVLVLGGTSEIALATVRKLVASRCRTVVLAGREPERAAEAVADLRDRGATTVEAVAFDALDTAGHGKVVDEVFDRFGDIDLVLLAFGVLGEQADFDADPEAAVQAVRANYVGGVSAGLATAAAIRRQGHGTLVVLSSVAGVRARKANYVYGSSKAGLDAFAQGLGDSLADAGGRVLIVRPGFVRTRMTAGMPDGPFATDADAVADAVVSGLQRNAEIVYAPGFLRWIFGAFRLLPRPLWRIISAR